MLTILQAFFGYLARVPAAIARNWDRFFFTPADPIMYGYLNPNDFLSLAKQSIKPIE